MAEDTTLGSFDFTSLLSSRGAAQDDRLRRLRRSDLRHSICI